MTAASDAYFKIADALVKRETKRVMILRGGMDALPAGKLKMCACESLNHLPSGIRECTNSSSITTDNSLDMETKESKLIDF